MLVGLIGTALAPALAVMLLAVVGLIGTLGVAKASGPHAAQPRTVDGKRTSALTSGVRILLTVAFFVGIAEGPLTVSFTAAATRNDMAAASGPLISALALGSVLGALFYGARSWRMRPPARLAAHTTMLTAALLILAAATTSVAALAPAAVVVGLALAPAITSIAICVNTSAPSEAMAEAFAWISFATPCGAAAAQALAGTPRGRTRPTMGLHRKRGSRRRRSSPRHRHLAPPTSTGVVEATSTEELRLPTGLVLIRVCRGWAAGGWLGIDVPVSGEAELGQPPCVVASAELDQRRDQAGVCVWKAAVDESVQYRQNLVELALCGQQVD
jgi:hypothetical protein